MRTEAKQQEAEKPKRDYMTTQLALQLMNANPTRDFGSADFCAGLGIDSEKARMVLHALYHQARSIGSCQATARGRYAALSYKKPNGAAPVQIVRSAQPANGATHNSALDMLRQKRAELQTEVQQLTAAIVALGGR